MGFLPQIFSESHKQCMLLAKECSKVNSWESCKIRNGFRTVGLRRDRRVENGAEIILLKSLKYSEKVNFFPTQTLLF